MPCVTGDPIAFLHCHLLSRSSGRWNRSTASWSAPALTLLSTTLGGRLGRLPARTTKALLIYPCFPRFAQLMPAAAPARNGAAEPAIWKSEAGPAFVASPWPLALPLVTASAIPFGSEPRLFRLDHAAALLLRLPLDLVA
jgi:hypothetical protein